MASKGDTSTKDRKGIFSRIHDRLFEYSYTTRVTVTFALVAIMTVIVAMGVLSYVWEQHFQAYTRENVQELADATAESVAARYEANHAAALEAGGGASDMGYPPIGMDDVQPAQSAHMLQPGMGIQVTSAKDGQVIYDSSLPDAVASPSPANPQNITAEASFAPGGNDKVATSSIVLSNGKAVGSVHMWVYGSEVLLSKADETFRNQSYQAMAFAAVLSVVLASCIGFLFARGLVDPINRMTRTAAAIKEGDLSARTNLEGNDEIAELGKTFDAMAESVEKNQQLERRLTMDVAHELRTPLMAIQSTVEAIVDGVFEPDEERLGTVNAEVQRLGRLVDALLRLSRLENRSTPMNEEVINVGELIRPLVMSHEAFVRDAGLSLEFDAEDEVMVYGDRDMIRQATANLISNAVRYTPAPGKVSVIVRKGDIMASIAVRDTGIGLSPEECKMVFNRFWRAEESRERQSGGLGVGLAVVKEIVDRHGGWVQVEGKKGEGACFTIHIPLYDYDRIKAMKEKKDPKDRASGKTGGMRKLKAKK
ncbi:MAG: HAMP domain-containing sensor histidine kinase [Slackia sp.]|nr:HAMP domain-containing sensor histidine kinase [Slackia sp.]